MNFSFLSIRVSAVLALFPAMMFAQSAADVTAQSPATSQTPSVQAPQPVPASGRKSSVPDYPDTRTLTIGLMGWFTLPTNRADVIGGDLATTYSTLDHLGKQHFETPGVLASVPVTRTGELKFEGFLAKGDGTQNAPATTAVFSTGYTKGDFLSTQYQITALKLSYDDLLYPFRFPVSKFRLKSLWEVQYIAVNGTFDAPKKTTTDSAGNLISNAISGNKYVILPTFGIAAEYAIAPHVLLRGAASAFGLPHRSEIWDGEASVSYRRKSLELRGGYKALHIKTSPKKEEYYTDTLSGPFVAILYHW